MKKKLSGYNESSVTSVKSQGKKIKFTLCYTYGKFQTRTIVMYLTRLSRREVMRFNYII